MEEVDHDDKISRLSSLIERHLVTLFDRKTSEIYPRSEDIYDRVDHTHLMKRDLSRRNTMRSTLCVSERLKDRASPLPDPIAEPRLIDKT